MISVVPGVPAWIPGYIPNPPFKLLVVPSLKMIVALPAQVMPAHEFSVEIAVISTPFSVTVAPSAMVRWVFAPPVPETTCPLPNVYSPKSDVSSMGIGIQCAVSVILPSELLGIVTLFVGVSCPS